MTPHARTNVRCCSLPPQGGRAFSKAMQGRFRVAFAPSGGLTHRGSFGGDVNSAPQEAP